MLAGDFQHKLKKLNKNLQIISGDEKYPAGLYLMFYGEPVHICGVDRNIIPERTISDGKGHIVKSGWIRVLKILIAKQFIDPNKASSLFGIGRDELYKGYRHIEIAKDPTYQALEEITKRRMEQKDGYVVDKQGEVKPVYTRQDFMDWGEVRKLVRK